MVQIKGPGYTSAYVVVVFFLFVINRSDWWYCWQSLLKLSFHNLEWVSDCCL